MVFSSSLFLVCFLPVLLIFYLLTPQRFRNYLLIVASIFFYAWGAPKFVFVVVATTIIDFFLVREMHAATDHRKRKLLLVTSIVLNLGLLFFFKYFDFFVGSLAALFGVEHTLIVKVALPLAISFYTFETITYVVDVYRGIHPPQKNILNYLLYILFFPKMIVGPIIRYHEIAGQINDRSKNENAEERIAGFIRFSVGLGKKVLIADFLAKYVNGVFSPQLHELSTANAWLGASAFIFQLYFDFSGYSDMAVGLGRMFGFRLPENFNNPLTASSLTEFWKRWHMTLGTWMKNYLYLPLGGSRVSTPRLLMNLWIVFLVSGLWHGASWNFVVWGALHGLVIMLERIFLLKIYSRLGRVVPMIVTLCVVIMTGVFFRAESIPQAASIVSAMLGNGQGAFFAPSSDFWLAFALASGFSFFVLPAVGSRIQHVVFCGTSNFSVRVLLTTVATILFIVSLAFITASEIHPFIYFRF